MMKTIQKILIAGASSLAILMRKTPLIAVPVVIFGVWAHYSLKKLMTVIEGNNNRGEVDDRSVASLK